jgi:glyoxylase-like metal-dependent hydrolase (beta-lactamase superfamily II)
MWERYVPDIDDKYRLPVGLNSLVIRGGGKTVLVDTGCGDKVGRAPGAMDIEHTGKLLENLQAEGIAPEDVDIVLNSHLHFDHCGGNTVADGGTLRPAYPRARYILQKGEWDAALHPNERTRGTYLAENIEPLDAAKEVELVDGDAEVLPGVRMLRAPGHTADHIVVEVESGGDYALYIGELSQHPVQIERLAWISAFDIMPVVSLETKKR